MRDDDLRNFFDEDAYNELLAEYAERDQKKKTPEPDEPARAPHRSAAPQQETRRVERRAASERAAQRRAAETPAAPAASARAASRQSTAQPRQSRASAPMQSASAPRRTAQNGQVSQSRPLQNTQPERSRPAYPRIDDAPIRPLEPAKPPLSKENFKLDIQGLEEEFSPATRRPRRAERGQQSTGAFSAFPEIIKKRAPQSAKDGADFIAHDAREPLPDGGAVAAKRFRVPSKAELKAFFIQNKKTWIILGICIVASIFLSIYTISCINDVLAINRDSETIVTVSIPADADTRTVLKILKDNNLIEHRFFCEAVASIMRFRDDNYLTGIYYVTASMGVEKMLSTFKVAPTTGETVTLTFPEGYTVDQIVAKLAEYEVCSADVMYQTMREVDFSSEYSFIQEMDDKEDRFRMLEGYLYPDTYEFYIGENPSSVIRKFLNNFQKKWTEEYAKQAEALNMTVDDVITLASIIQKEAYGEDQSPLVSSVLHNRLDNSGLYPSLQCDSTTEYINEYIAASVTDAAELSRYTELYSSYRCEGLPVGAICNPGDDAINAALFPEDTNYYFFAHDVNRKLYLARNDSERRQNNLTILTVNRQAEEEG